MRIIKHRCTTLLLAVGTVALIVSILIVDLNKTLESTWKRKCYTSKCLEVWTALQHYERAESELPGMDSRERFDKCYSSWRVAIVKWMNNRGANKNVINSGAQNLGSRSHIFTCTDSQNTPGSDVLGVFTDRGDWAFKSDLRYWTPHAKYVLIVMPGKNDDWTRAGDLVLEKDGSIYYYAPPFVKESVNIEGCIGIDATGTVEVIAE